MNRRSQIISGPIIRGAANRDSGMLPLATVNGIVNERLSSYRDTEHDCLGSTLIVLRHQILCALREQEKAQQQMGKEAVAV
jgi:hypothetical protein